MSTENSRFELRAKNTGLSAQSYYWYDNILKNHTELFLEFVLLKYVSCMNDSLMDIVVDLRVRNTLKTKKFGGKSSPEKISLHRNVVFFVLRSFVR